MKKKVAIICNHASFFLSHRLGFAKCLKDNGFTVALYTGLEADVSNRDKNRETLKIEEIEHNIYNLKPNSWNLFSEIKGLISLITDLKRDKVEIVHCTSQKGIIVSCICTLFLKIRAQVISFSGLGSLFLNKNLFFRFLQTIYFLIIKISSKNVDTYAIFQNKYDQKLFEEKNIFCRNKVIRTNGSGIDLTLYRDLPEMHERKKTVLFPSRVIRDKGIIEFIKACEILAPKYKSWNFLIAGSYEYESISSIDSSLIQRSEKNKNIQFLGHVDDMSNLFKQTRIVCLPSYREGFPKSLMEASAAGCAIATTNVPGCNEVVDHGVNGLLAEPKSYESLVNSLEHLMKNEDKLLEYSEKLEKKASKNYCQKKIHTKILKKIYNKLDF